MKIIFIILCALFYQRVECRIGCKGLDGRKVDWFIVYKLPVDSKSGHNGSEFLYLDPSNTNWTSSRKTIHDDSVAVGATLEQIYRKEPTSFRLMYSDDPPNRGSDGYRGHAKGVLLFDSVTGFWMIHSAPNFPPIASYSYPKSAIRYAQTFLCVSLKSQSLEPISKQLRVIQATPFDHNLPDKFRKKYPDLYNVIKKKSLPKSATIFAYRQDISTEDGVKLISFAKHKKFNRDLWGDWVAPQSRTSIAVQSWLNGGGDDLHSSCRREYSVYDLQTISIPGQNFTSSKDHSKWAVSENKGVPLVCVGDINRQKSQFSRGGGAVCMENSRIWNTYKKSVATFEPCKISPKNTWNYSLVLMSTLFSSIALI